jgi:phosphoadenosine phosphosulfate reductase
MNSNLFVTENKESISIKRLKHWEPAEGYHLAFSGGKDSIVIKKLADLANVKYDSHYNVTSVDPPELIWYIKEHHSDTIFDYPKYKDSSNITMWNLIVKKKIPPTRFMRYCCQYLKEGSGIGRVIMTGVRWAESNKRLNNRAGIEIINGKKRRELEDPDNPDNERTARICGSKGKYLVNPIIDWSDEDVWNFIKKYNLPYCMLYDKGFKRLGCVGCPMSINQKFELEMYPKFKNLYLKAFKKMLENYNEKNRCNWKNENEVFDWWINGKKHEDNFNDIWNI